MTTRVLLVEDDPADVHVLRRYLDGSRRHRFALEQVDGLEAALGRLRDEAFELVLLGLPRSAHAARPRAP